jgi:2-polyprenyl-6-methoxyphenol hydroxylase-like FAD-dependent oxidoreductase
MTQQHAFAGKTAIVIGASMGGLLAARALADHFEQVTLLERDAFPAPGEQRKGVPQGRHAHAVLAQGLQIMEGYFPGLIEQLVSLGADYGDVSEKARWFHEGACHQPTHSGVNAINISRPRLEAAVRARVLALPNVQAIEGCDVLGLLATPDNARVTGVRVIRRRADSAEESLSADLIVDTTGRGSRSPAWLEALGYARPQEEAVKIGVSYTSCVYERRPEHIPGVNALIVAAAPENPRGGVLLSQEGNRWILTVAAYRGEQIPLDQAGLREFVRSMATPALYDVIKDAQPVGEPVPHKIPSNLRRRYEKLTRFPAGYLVTGDALCSFNPIYAQGMSVAALEAQALGACLAQGEAKLASRFFKQASKIIDIPWSTAVGNDLRFPEIEGPRTAMTKFINWYVGKLHHAAHHDAEVSVAFLKVVNLLAPPPSIMAPGIMWRVWRGNRRRSLPATNAGDAYTVFAQQPPVR